MHRNVLEIFVHFCGYSVRFSSLSGWTFNNDSKAIDVRRLGHVSGRTRFHAFFAAGFHGFRSKRNDRWI